MPTGAITQSIDVAQLVLYAFWIFFAGLIWYLHRENKREGYPLESDRSDRAPRVAVQGFPRVPEPKTYLLAHGGTVSVPDRSRDDRREVRARPVARHPGAPLEPTGDPMADGVGPAAYAQRADRPDLTVEGAPRIVPVRVATDHALAAEDPDPRGMVVFGGDGSAGGVVRDVWVDRSEAVVRYLEIEVAGGARRLLPINFARVTGGAVRVKSILGRHFPGVPALAQPDQVTLLEEERVMAYYGGGHLYAEPSRQEPLF
jgi:photosynthetic reaction center H subunit